MGYTLRSRGKLIVLSKTFRSLHSHSVYVSVRFSLTQVLQEMSSMSTIGQLCTYVTKDEAGSYQAATDPQKVLLETFPS